MKRIKFYLAFVAMAAMLVTSCSKEDNGDGLNGPDGAEMVTLSFEGALSDFTKKVNTKQSETGEDASIPECNEDSTPSEVVVGVKDSQGNWVTGGKITIPVIPTSVDSDGDGAANYLTFEAEELELEEGDYTLEYFAVYNSGGDLILMAPRSDNNYGPANFYNFVESPLPQDIDLKAGTKHYQEVEVLCYDEQKVQEYGYLFFDFEELPLTYICIFGNECDEDGRHAPSHFRVKVWEYPALPGDEGVVFTDENALVNGTNDFNNGENVGEVTQADPLCIPLPDRDGENWFYGEIYTIDNQGNEKLIRRGDFSDEDTKDPAFEINGKQKYWHFREGPYCGEDSNPCLLSTVLDESEDFNSANSFDDVTIGDTEYAWSGNTSEDPYGTYNIVTNANEFYVDFPNLLDADGNPNGKFAVFDGDDLDPNETVRRVYYTQEIPTVCEGDMYYISMDLVDISTPNEGDGGNDAQIEVTANGVQIALFEISDLANYDTWTKVGFTLMADSSGNINFEISDPDGSWKGNDFGMDNINISNDPTSLNDVDHFNPGPVAN